MRISILGAGWLGLALGEYLVKKGYEVNGSVTTASKIEILKSKGINPFHFGLNPAPEPKGVIEKFLDADVIVIGIPPSRKSDDMDTFHPAQMKELTKYMLEGEIRKTIYISSTSVYPSPNKEVKESDATKPDVFVGNPMVLAERVLRQTGPLDTTVLRVGGLMGYNRIPGKYASGKKDLDNGNSPVNFVHRDDVIGVIEQVIEQGKWNRVFNVSAPEHPLRKDLYPEMANRFGFEPPVFNYSSPADYKIVNTDKLAMELKYEFKYPDPFTFYYEL
ncbi:NAD(P)H-binding protein [Chondrinema litorale]|uniref:NAD(P)H-binding protein n=1 Tax=Chondrinema litorale TaxID=2994555 RepID=UPI0025428B85|nr:NAD(P)H-binding protein [Chondrinema litorale]UZR92700.1 SDR family NAD(P)-dependent oxidoreductase [Chondrinema litorale]